MMIVKVQIYGKKKMNIINTFDIFATLIFTYL